MTGIISGKQGFLHSLIPQTRAPVDCSHLPILLPIPVSVVRFGFPSLGTQVQPMEESYEEVVIKLIQQEGTCLDFQQLPCWTVMERYAQNVAFFSESVDCWDAKSQ